MKSLKLLSIITLLVLAMVGCSAPVDQAAADREKELENRIAELEQEITSLEKEAGTTSQANEPAVTPPADDKAAVDSLGTLDTLQKNVSDAVDKVNSAAPSGTASENQNTFFALKNELDSLDQQIDSYDEYLESQYRQNLMSREDYRSQERELERLEEELDRAEDKLERTFRMDD